MRRNIPRVTIVNGRVSNTKIGFTNVFTAPKTKDTTSREVIESIFTPGMMYAATYTESVRTISLISSCFILNGIN